MTPDVQWAICSICLPPGREKKELSVKTCDMPDVYQSTKEFGSLHVEISPVFVSPCPHVGDVWCTLSINTDLSTQLSQTKTKNISADSCLQCFSRVFQKVLNSTQWHSWKFCIHTNWGLRILNVVWSSFLQQRSDLEGSLESCMSLSIKMQLHF